MKTVSLLTALALAAPAQSAQVAVATTGARFDATLTVPFGRTIRFNRIELRPTRIVEDSRCPQLVQCVWRGRLRVEFAVGGGVPVTLESGQPVALRGARVTLVDAVPVSQRGEKAPPQAYRFTLRIQKP